MNHNLLLSEFDLMAAYQQTPDSWFALDRGWRALMLAHHQITTVMHAITEYDRYQWVKAHPNG